MYKYNEKFSNLCSLNLTTALGMVFALRNPWYLFINQRLKNVSYCIEVHVYTLVSKILWFLSGGSSMISKLYSKLEYWVNRTPKKMRFFNFKSSDSGGSTIKADEGDKRELLP